MPTCLEILSQASTALNGLKDGPSEKIDNYLKRNRKTAKKLIKALRFLWKNRVPMFNKKSERSEQISGLDLTTMLLTRIGEINEILTTHYTKKRDLKTLKNLFKEKEKTLIISPSSISAEPTKKLTER